MSASTPPPSNTTTTASTATTTTTPSSTTPTTVAPIAAVVAAAAEHDNNDNNNSNIIIQNKSVEEQELIRLALHRSPYFTCLTEEQVARFVLVAELRSFRPGQAVILEGCQDDRDDEEEAQDYLPTRRSTLPSTFTVSSNPAIP
jgi:hypothetical protein